MKKNRVIIAGGQNFNDYDLLRMKVNYYTFMMEPGSIEIVSGKQMTVDKDTGECYGADYFGERYADHHGIPVKEFPANWKKYGKSGGPIRNKEMAAYGTHLIAFWDGQSSGTRNMIEEAKKARIAVKIVRY